MLSNQRPYLVIAGPGAGKTTGLVDVFLQEIELAPAHKFVAVITYTNASADDITHALQQKAALGKNVFVGTIHSFINQFVVIPFACHAGKAPVDFSFIDEIPGLDRNNRAPHYAKLDALARKGLITHDQSIRLARSILESEEPIVDHIANRLHAVLVDEYQDVTVPQEAIFSKLVKTKRSRFYFVGDPEQFVYKFMADSPRKQTTLPIVKMAAFPASKVTLVRKTENHRSTGKIVEFLNQLGSHTQVAQNTLDNESSVLFLQDTDIDQAYAIFRERQEALGLLNSKTFVLGEGLRSSSAHCLTQIKHILASNNERSRILADTEALVCGLLQKNKQQILEEYGIDRLKFRQQIFSVLRVIIDKGFQAKDDITAYIVERYTITHAVIDQAWLSSLAVFEKLVEATTNQREEGIEGVFKSTIRKSKGLQAECTLVVARTENELKKWIETDQAKRFNDGSDQSQMGFVAFSRAKKLLAIMCTKPITRATLQKIEALEVETISCRA